MALTSASMVGMPKLRLVDYQGKARPWQIRWAIIEPHLPVAEPGDLAIDVGAAEGHFAAALAFRGFDTHAWETKRPKPLTPNLNWSESPFSPMQLATLPKKPLKVALLLSVLHHLDDWKSSLDAVEARAEWVFVEPPTEYDGAKGAAIHREVLRRGEVVGEARARGNRSVRPMVLIRGAA